MTIKKAGPTNSGPAGGNEEQLLRAVIRLFCGTYPMTTETASVSTVVVPLEVITHL